jgi:hypothetical protein
MSTSTIEVTVAGIGVDARNWIGGQRLASARPAHPALVSEADFVAAQTVRAARATADNDHRTYRLTGLLRCARRIRSPSPRDPRCTIRTASPGATPRRAARSASRTVSRRMPAQLPDR